MPSTIVLITGANTGIGYVTAAAFAASENPYHVILTARSPEKGQAALAKLRSEHPDTKSTLSFLPLDVTDHATITSAAASVEKDFGHLDILINNAGIIGKSATLIERLRETFETNTFGPAVVTDAFKPLLLKSSSARLIYLSSSLGSIALRTDPTHWTAAVPALEYRMSKAALNMLAMNSQAEFGKDKVKVWTYCPGYVVTDLSRTGEKGLEERKQRGAKDPKESAEGIMDLVEGRRDADVGKFVHKDGVYSW